MKTANPKMPEENMAIAEQFEDASQQRDAAHLGMWVFIATEVLFFGGLFLAYVVYRHFYFHAFALGSSRTDLFYGTLNSVILLTSSFTMALAVQSAKRNQARVIQRFLHLTILLGSSFLVVKGFEYHKDIADQLVPGTNFNRSLPVQSQVFFWLYWTMTGLHAVHIFVGLNILTVMTLLARRGRFSSQYCTPVEITGLYWHFVDIVWLFLYPLLYLIDRHT
jgi:cytochrome c oxidase subunit 3